MATSPNIPEPAAFPISDTLAQHAFFDVLQPDQLAWIAEQATLQTFSQGEIIFLEGEVCHGMWVIEEGSVKIYKLNPEGAEHILHLLGPGHSFNDVSALDGGPNPAHASAMTDTRCWLIPSVVVVGALHTYPEMAISVVGKLTARVRMLVEHIETLALYPVAARLARFLLQQAESATRGAPRVSRAAIAAHLATTPETVSRVLRSFEEAGAIQFDRQRIVIVDQAAMRMLAIL